jgi:hypothetical protein
MFPRYSILPHSDPERCFSIEPEDGTIRTAVSLDREARVWHNLTVLATELGEEAWAPEEVVSSWHVSEHGWGRAVTAIIPAPVCSSWSLVWSLTTKQASCLWLYCWAPDPTFAQLRTSGYCPSETLQLPTCEWQTLP